MVAKSAPDDHFTAGPNCRVIGSRIGRIGGAGGCPAICAGIVSPTSVQTALVPTPPQTIISLPVQTAVCANRALGALVALVAVQLFVLGLYLPPVFNSMAHRSHSAPDDHFTAGPHCRVDARASGALVVLVAVQLSVLGLYLPPVLKSPLLPRLRPRRSFHCQSKLPCGLLGASGALVVLVAVQLSVLGLYLPPVLKSCGITPAPDDHLTAGPTAV